MSETDSTLGVSIARAKSDRCLRAERACSYSGHDAAIWGGNWERHGVVRGDGCIPERDERSRSDPNPLARTSGRPCLQFGYGGRHAGQRRQGGLTGVHDGRNGLHAVRALIDDLAEARGRSATPSPGLSTQQWPPGMRWLSWNSSRGANMEHDQRIRSAATTQSMSDDRQELIAMRATEDNLRNEFALLQSKYDALAQSIQQCVDQIVDGPIKVGGTD